LILFTPLHHPIISGWGVCRSGRTFLKEIFCLRLFPLFSLLLFSFVFPQQNAGAEAAPPTLSAGSLANLPDAPNPLDSGSVAQQQSVPQPSGKDAHGNARTPPPQPKRILGIMPNYRAVSAGEIPPPPTPKQAFGIATRNSFDYSAFVFTGLTSLIAEGQNSHPQLGKGVPGFWAYSWRGFVDKTDGNYWVIFALPAAFHEDERYFALGRGSIWKRAVYASSRVAITRNYQGQNTINASELLGRGIAQGISTAYYPSQDRTASELASKYGYAILRDAATNTFREFWPDIAVHVLHRHP